MPVDYSVVVNASAGFNTVTLPSAGTLIGVRHFCPYLSIQIDPSHNAVVPGFVAGRTSKPYVAVYWPITASSFQFYVPSAGLCVFYFGTPDGDAVPLSALTGVVQSVSLQNSATSATTITSTVQFNFLSRARLMGALVVVQDNNSTTWQFSFTASAGYSVNLAVDPNTGLIEDLSSVIPLDSIPVAQQITVAVQAVVNASATSTALVVFYYRVE